VDLPDRASSVITREDLVGLLNALADDLDGYYANRGEDASKMPPWRMLADMLMAGRVYE